MPIRIWRAGRVAIQKRDSLTSFNDFGLAEPILRALREEKYETPTPIQAQTIPLAMQARDVIGIAQTGTGKTAAFALPILNHLGTKRLRPAQKACRVLVLSPTRELSGTNRRQLPRLWPAYPPARDRPGDRRRVDRAAETLARARRRRAGGDTGPSARSGEPARAAPRPSRGAGARRSRPHARHGLHPRHPPHRRHAAERAADAVLFGDHAAGNRQALRANAARSGARRGHAAGDHRRARRAARDPDVEKASKPALLAELLKSEPVERVLVFTRTKHGADKVVRSLQKAGLAADAIHGNKSQGQRERVLAAFRTGRVRTLIATDIAARGIDVDGVSHVVNYDLPNIPEILRPPHRPHRARRRRRRRDLVLRSRRGAVPARHRAADPHVDPRNRPAHRHPPGASPRSATCGGPA